MKKSDTLISTMKDCDSPLYSVVHVIAWQSEFLYRTVKNLSQHQPADVDIKMVDIPSSDINNLCYCSVVNESV